MHKVLQALLDTIQLAAGAVELGSAAHSPTNHSQPMRRHAAARPAIDRDLLTERAGRSELQPFVGESALQASVEKSRM